MYGKKKMEFQHNFFCSSILNVALCILWIWLMDALTIKLHNLHALCQMFTEIFFVLQNIALKWTDKVKKKLHSIT